MGSDDWQFKKLSRLQSNQSFAELPLSSDKTIKFVKSIEKIPQNKLLKGKKKAKVAKVQREEEEQKVEEKCGITRRKVE